MDPNQQDPNQAPADDGTGGGSQDMPDSGAPSSDTPAPDSAPIGGMEVPPPPPVAEGEGEHSDGGQDPSSQPA